MQPNQQTFNRFQIEMLANGIRPCTIRNYRITLAKLDVFLKGKRWEDASREDMVGFFAAITPCYKPRYVHNMKNRVKAFYSWLFDLERGDYPPSVHWIRAHNPRSRSKVKGVETSISPQNVLKDDDVLKLIEAADHPRDAAILSLSYEVGPEANELLAMKVGSVMFDRYGGRVILEGTGGTRTLRVVDSIPYLQAWINVHPAKHDKEAPLWVVRDGKAKGMSYSNLYKICQTLKRHADVRKPVHPRALRHGCLTKMAKVLPEQLLKKFAGWTPDSKMAATYVHLNSKDVDDAILRAHDREPMETPKLGRTALTPKTCPRCGTDIAPTWFYCPKCSLSFIRGTEFTFEQLVTKLMQDEEEIARLMRKYGLDPRLAKKPTHEELAKRFSGDQQ